MLFINVFEKSEKFKMNIKNKNTNMLANIAIKIEFSFFKDIDIMHSIQEKKTNSFPW